jgi:hypothetical protein
MIKYYFRYSDGMIFEKEFESYHEASWFAFNEGDHLMDWGPVKE